MNADVSYTSSMMRFLIFILVFNTFAAPALAKSNCCLTMMEETMEIVQLEQDASESMSETMKVMLDVDDCLMCDKDKDNKCGVLDCTYHLSSFTLSSESLTTPKLVLFRSFILSSISLSKLVLPVSTPPPLV